MPARPADLVAAARSLLGVPFALHGRDPKGGLDCLGLVGAALAACAIPIALPCGYRLRASCPTSRIPAAPPSGLVEAYGGEAPGDIVLLQPGPCQVHAVILSTPRGYAIHAHAGLRRVVEAPLPPTWPRLARWRLSLS